jgi:phosphoketolase
MRPVCDDNGDKVRAVRLVNVVDLMKLQSPSEHPHDRSGGAFGSHRPVIR